MLRLSQFTAVKKRLYSLSVRPAAFTSAPEYYELLYFLDDILIKTAPLKTILALKNNNGESSSNFVLPGGFWMPQAKLQSMLHSVALSASHYSRIRERLTALAPRARLVPELADFLLTFQNDPSSKFLTQEKDEDEEGRVSTYGRKLKTYGHIDRQGRIVAKGARKTANATVFMVPGTGQILINNKPLSLYFYKFKDRAATAKPFAVAAAHNCLNTWVDVHGGGLTGTIHFKKTLNPKNCFEP